MAAPLIILALWLWLFYFEENGRSIEAIAEGPANYEPAYPLLSHKLLQIEADRLKLKNKALVNRAHFVTDWIIGKAKSLPKLPDTPTRDDVVAFFTQANNLIDNYFTYKARTLFSEGLVSQSIDCDLRSFLFYDISKIAGLDSVSVVYSPGHAFIGWRDPKSDSPLFWETTAGEQVDLSNSIYRRANDDYYYRMLPTNHVVTTWSLYNAYTAISEGNDVEEDIAHIKTIADQYPNYAYYQVLRISAELQTKDEIEEDDVIRLKDVLKMSPNDIQANWYLMHHYLETGQVELAKERLDAIPPGRRTADMLEKYAAELRWWMPSEHLWKLYAWGFGLYSILMSYNDTPSDLVAYELFLAFNVIAIFGIVLYRFIVTGHYKIRPIPIDTMFGRLGRPTSAMSHPVNSTAHDRTSRRGMWRS